MTKTKRGAKTERRDPHKQSPKPGAPAVRTAYLPAPSALHVRVATLSSGTFTLRFASRAATVEDVVRALSEHTGIPKEQILLLYKRNSILGRFAVPSSPTGVQQPDKLARLLGVDEEQINTRAKLERFVLEDQSHEATKMKADVGHREWERWSDTLPIPITSRSFLPKLCSPRKSGSSVF